MVIRTGSSGAAVVLWMRREGGFADLVGEGLRRDVDEGRKRRGEGVCSVGI